MNNTFYIKDDWEYHTLEPHIKLMDEFYNNANINEAIIFDFDNLNIIDSSGMVLIIRYMNLFKDKNIDINLKNISSKHKKMYDLYKLNYVHEDDIEVVKKSNFLEDVGDTTLSLYENFKNFSYFIGKILATFFYTLRHPSLMKFKATINQMDIAAIQILPIIALSLFLVGFVTAYQGADQLGRFGASVIIVEMSTMSMFREIAPFLAAVIVAGRSASSFTAQIGTMKITEEISAMKTMGLDVDRFLIIPRLIALVVVMPLIVFFADMASLLGEMVIVKIHLGIPYTQFIDRIYEYVEIRHILLGLCKAPLFGLLIGIIGCYRGLQVKKGTDIGKYTTKAVVDSIFWLIIVNALISLLSIELGF